MKRRDSFSSSGGYWARPDHTGRAPSLRVARDRASFDHHPRPGVLARLANALRGSRR